MEPFALQIHRRIVAGETCEQLADELGIPAERIQARYRAAVRHLLYRGSKERHLGHCAVCGTETLREKRRVDGLAVSISICLSCVQRALAVDGNGDSPRARTTHAG